MPTLPCVEEHEDERRSHIQVISEALAESVRQGLEEKRVVQGIELCVQQIKRGPDEVMMCLLIQLSASLDPNLKVPLLLIKTFCLDNDIGLLNVLGENKMTQLLSSCLSQAKCRNVDVLTPAPTSPTRPNLGGSAIFDPGCIMIKYPKLHMSYEDDLVTRYVKENIKSGIDPSVLIPVVTEAGMDKTLGFKLKTKKVKLVAGHASSQPDASS